jgi:histidine ammonia-lyase
VPVGTSSAAVNLAAALEPAHLELAREPLHVGLPDEVRARVARCREFVLEVSGSGCAVHGVTTGFGPLVEYAGRADSAVPARLFSLAQGRSGVSEQVPFGTQAAFTALDVVASEVEGVR